MTPAADPPSSGWPRKVMLGGALSLAMATVATLAIASPSPPARGRAAAGRCLPKHLNTSAVLPRTGIAVSPLPGSYDASPSTQISLLGAPASALAGLRVRGSQSGPHRGALRAYSQGDGASFLPARPFRSGETVTVRGDELLGDASKRRFSYSFTVARRDALLHVLQPHHHGYDPNEKQHFISAPQLQPPSIAVTARSPETAPGYLFAAPYGGPGASGPMIFDESGDLVWFHPLPHGTEAANLQVQQLAGQPVLSYWQGYIPLQGFGEGEEVILDSSYRQIGRVRAGNGYEADLHDFSLTPQGTALLTVFDPIECNLSAVGGPAAGAVTDSMFQEIDLATGLVRREWHSLDHVGLAETYVSPRGASNVWPFDYFHLNSLDELAGGTTLISARNTWALYELNTLTGRVVTRIGGRHSDLRLAPGTATAFQHDATRLPNGEISIFDNGAAPKVHRQSRGVLMAVDPASRSARTLAQYLHPKPLSSGSQGNLQVLSNGDVFIGWGAVPYFSEFSSAGRLLFDAHMHGSYESYRAYRFAWTGTPAAPPAIAVSPPPANSQSAAAPTVHASWNGDTRTARWRVLAGPSPEALEAVAEAARSGFETAIQIPAPAAYLAVQALDDSGALLGASAVVHG